MIISLRQKKISNGRLSLFLEYNKGNYTDAEGKIKRNRDFEYLKLYILENPKTSKEKQQNKETMQLAENILAIRQADFVRGKFDLQDNKKQDAIFLDYYCEKKNEFPEGTNNHGVWSSAQIHLEAYCPKNFNFAQVAPEASIYKMDRRLGYIVKSDKKDAIKSLTGGLNAINIFYENRKQIFVEASFDRYFLENIYALVQNVFLDKEILLQFITAGSDDKEGGCARVKQLVKTLSDAGNIFIHGIIDWDLTNNGSEKVVILGNKQRYSIENYYLDPIGVTSGHSD